MTEIDRSSDSFRAWATRVRELHRLKRGLGLAGSGAGLILLAWSRIGDGPDWGVPAGLGVIAASWALLGWTIWARYRWVKQNPYRDP